MVVSLLAVSQTNNCNPRTELHLITTHVLEVFMEYFQDYGSQNELQSSSESTDVLFSPIISLLMTWQQLV